MGRWRLEARSSAAVQIVQIGRSNANSCVLLAALLCPLVLLGQNQVGVEELRASVVKITSKAPEGQPRTGTGFIVRVDGELIYIATASHVVEGDPKPQVTFYHDKRRPVAAEIGELEVDNATAGLGYLIVRDRAVAEKVKALGWSAGILRGGEDVLAIGFGQGAGEWGVIKGTVASASGSDIRIDGRIEEGNSGGPIIMNGSVAGMVTSIKQGFGVGKSGIIVQINAPGMGCRNLRSDYCGSGAGSTPRRREVPSLVGTGWGRRLHADLPARQRQERRGQLQLGRVRHEFAGVYKPTIGSDHDHPHRSRQCRTRGAGYVGPRWRSYDSRLQDGGHGRVHDHAGRQYGLRVIRRGPVLVGYCLRSN